LERLCTDGGGYFPTKYSGFVEVIRKTKAEILAPHRRSDHVIAIEPGYQFPYGRIYNLSDVKVGTLKAYIETNLVNGFIQRLPSSAAAPFSFTKKKDGGLRLWVVYWALNKAMVNNLYPVSLDIGDAGPTSQSTYYHKSGTSECQSPHPDTTRQ
jgi:hypothetical protein